MNKDIQDLKRRAGITEQMMAGERLKPAENFIGMVAKMRTSEEMGVDPRDPKAIMNANYVEALDGLIGRARDIYGGQ